MKTSGLMQDASCYNTSELYDYFSLCEDHRGFVVDFIKDVIGTDNVVLDLGCGTGKYTQLLSNIAQYVYALDISHSQISYAKEKINAQNIDRMVHDATKKFDLTHKVVDNVICCWMLGTIGDEYKREQCVQNVMKNIKTGGSFYCIDNGIDSEFEKIRNKHLTLPNQTERFHNRLENQGFKRLKTFRTEFVFPNKNIAKKVFTDIWGSDIGNNIKKSIIDHEVVVFERKK